MAPLPTRTRVCACVRGLQVFSGGGLRRVVLPWLLPRLSSGARIAVVGSSGNLVGRGHGAAIDAHTIVVRINDHSMLTACDMHTLHVRVTRASLTHVCSCRVHAQVRINNAPTKGSEADVGRHTHVRVGMPPCPCPCPCP